MPKKRSTYADTTRMILRGVSLRPDTINNETRSVEVVVATENPVSRMDSKRNMVIREVLSMDGVEFRTSRRQLPIVDSHDNSTVRNVYGSVRNLRSVGDELIGDAVFAEDQASQEAFAKLRDGHLTDFSITATPNEIMFVPRGESTQVRGRTIDGPAEIVTRWLPTDASLVAMGADERSTVRELRRSYELATTEEGGGTMSPEFINRLRESGLPEDVTDEQAIQEWIVSGIAPANDPEPVAEEQEASPEPELAAVGADDQETVDRAIKADRARQREIRALCQQQGIERSMADKWCDEGKTVQDARKSVLEVIARKKDALGGTGAPEVVGHGPERLRDAMRDGLIKRAVSAAGCRSYNPFELTPEAPGADDFQHMGLLRMAEQLLISGGIETRKLTNRDIAAVALGHSPTINRLNIRRDGEAYHVTGTFANLLLDAANKTLLGAYMESPYTWSMWARQAPSVADFKNVNRIRFSESPDPEMVPENSDYKEKATSDSKESYSVEKYGALFSVSWETIVNDDLDAISRIPAMHGNASRRKVNKVVYNILSANDLMGDGVALFGAHTSGTNTSGASAVPSTTTLNAGFLAMATQTGLTSGTIVGVTPRYLIVPWALAATADELVASVTPPSAGGSAVGTSGITNLYGPNGNRRLMVIADAQLDLSSTANWFLAADSSQIDTVEVAFLQGEETPVLESEWNMKNDTYTYKVRQTFGVKAIDWRGLYRNAA